MNHECDRAQRAWLDGIQAEQRVHVEGCAECRSFTAVERLLTDPGEPARLPVPERLVSETLRQLAPLMRRRARERRRLSIGLAAAGIASLPPIAAVNVAFGWMLHGALERLVSTEAALAGVSVYAASALLSLAIAYGSLPLMASWGVRLREETT